eukprot:GHVH01006169.1.p1 GENE.GHVH01006169.1~~GHVH01006169.1.p1  ORF type:complete len:548 (+),score=52.10 GHVH01006169.1:702-2345(+)
MLNARDLIELMIWSLPIRLFYRGLSTLTSEFSSVIPMSLISNIIQGLPGYLLVFTAIASLRDLSIYQYSIMPSLMSIAALTVSEFAIRRCIELMLKDIMFINTLFNDPRTLSWTELVAIPFYLVSAVELCILLTLDRVNLTTALPPEMLAVSLIIASAGVFSFLALHYCSQKDVLLQVFKDKYGDERKAFSIMPLFVVFLIVASFFYTSNYLCPLPSTAGLSEFKDEFGDVMNQSGPSLFQLLVNRLTGMRVFYLPKEFIDILPYGVELPPNYVSLFHELTIGLFLLSFGLMIYFVGSVETIIYRKYWHLVVFQALLIPFFDGVNEMEESFPDWDGSRGTGFSFFALLVVSGVVFFVTIMAKGHRLFAPHTLSAVSAQGLGLITDRREDGPIPLCIWEFFWGLLVTPLVHSLIVPALNHYEVLSVIPKHPQFIPDVITLCGATVCVGDSAASFVGVQMKKRCPKLTATVTLSNGKTVFGWMAYGLTSYCFYWGICRYGFARDSLISSSTVVIVLCMSATLESITGEYDNAISPLLANFVILSREYTR